MVLLLAVGTVDMMGLVVAVISMIWKPLMRLGMKEVAALKDVNPLKMLAKASQAATTTVEISIPRRIIQRDRKGVQC